LVQNRFQKQQSHVNTFLAAMAAANPVITVLLTVVVFLEKDKIKKRSEDLKAAVAIGRGQLKGATGTD
jgi:hypothetical protein